MTRNEGTRIGPWTFSRVQLLLGVFSVIVLAVNCWLLIQGLYIGKAWGEMLPTVVAALALAAVLVSIARKARRTDSR